MFEQAARLKVRFSTAMGPLNVEDLWDLPLTATRKPYVNLNDIAKGLNRELKDADDDNFVDRAASTTNTELKLKFDIVKHIIDVRLAENETARLAVEKRAKRDRILELIAKKQDESLAAKSVEELTEMVNTL